MEADIQQKMQKEYHLIKPDEELLKDAGYEITSKKKKEEAKLIVGARKRHTRDKNKFKIKSKALHNPSLLTKEFEKKDKNRTPSEQHTEP